MRFLNGKSLLIAVIISSVSAYICPTYAARILPMRTKVTSNQAKSVRKADQPSQYSQLLAKYLAYISYIEQKRKEARIEKFNDDLVQLRQSSMEPEKSEALLLAKLREMAQNSPDGKLDFQGDNLLLQSFIPTSASSARIFGTLLKENRADVLQIVSSLYSRAYILCPAWIQVVKDVAEQSSHVSPGGRWAMLVLYRSGMSRDIYQSTLVQLAVDNNDVLALDNLFFDVDKATGEVKEKRSNSNRNLMLKLIGRNSSPEIRVVCAQYATAIGKHGLAEATCADILSQKYRSTGNKNICPPKEDYSLARAKAAAMGLMFYTLKNEHVFKQIYDLSVLPQTEMDEEDKGNMPKGWVRSDFCPLVKQDIDYARALIWEVLHYVPVSR
jgi:hypothetical protein